MSNETVLDAEVVEHDTGATVAGDGERAKAPNFHRLPNSESFHLVRGESGQTVEDADADVNADIDAAEGHEDHRATFHKLPNSESFHLVKDHAASE